MKHKRIHREPQVDAQLCAAGMARDASNRPRSLLVIPAILVGLTLVFLLASVRDVAGARRSVAGAHAYAGRIDSLLEQIKTKQSSEVDFAKLYPPQPYLQAHIDDSLKTDEFTFDPKPIISSARDTIVVRDARVYQSTVQCRLQNQPLDRILAWIDAILRIKDHRGQAFLSQITLTPQGPGWQATFDISVYQKK